MTTLPSIYAIRESLSDIPGALVGDPWTSPVDLGETRRVPIHQPEPEQGTLAGAHEKWVDNISEEEPTIVFEIPLELDDRRIGVALSESGRDFEALVQTRGVDVLGWYVPFHYRNSQHGIYISSAGVLWLALQCFKGPYSENVYEEVTRKLQYAARAILRHETFHFAAECMAANWELIIGAPCYVTARNILKSSGGYVEHEEALANAYMLRGFRWESLSTRGAKATEALKRFMQNLPAGYRDGAKFVAHDHYAEGCRDLSSMYHTCMRTNWFAPRDTFDSVGLYPNISKIDWRRAPIILVDEANRGSRSKVL
jgi:hypothetical protein